MLVVPEFPAVLKLSDDDVMTYIESSQQLLETLQSQYHIDQALLIDSQGTGYSPVIQPDKTLEYQLTPEISLREFNQMVRNHLSARQQCCVLKIEIESFNQGFQLILKTAEQ